jgi:hypothetical protein
MSFTLHFPAAGRQRAVPRDVISPSIPLQVDNVLYRRERNHDSGKARFSVKISDFGISALMQKATVFFLALSMDIHRQLSFSSCPAYDVQRRVSFSVWLCLFLAMRMLVSPSVSVSLARRYVHMYILDVFLCSRASRCQFTTRHHIETGKKTHSTHSEKMHTTHSRHSYRAKRRR